MDRCKKRTTRNSKLTKLPIHVTPFILRLVAKAMLPFYETIGNNSRYAKAWSKAVVRADLQRLEKLYFKVSPNVKQSIGTNAIGYFINFTLRKSFYQYVNATAIPPGTVQFRFERRVHQAIARAVIPLYRELAANPFFTRAFAKAINRNDKRALRFMVKSLVKTRRLRSVKPDGNGGIILSFKYPFSKYMYQNVLFFDNGL